MLHFKSFINKKSLLRRTNSISIWPSLRKLKTRLFYQISIRIIFWHQNQSWKALIPFFCFYNEYIFLQMKEIYKMNILEEIIPILVLKWYFKIWICKVWEQGFRSWFKGPQQRQWGISGRWRIWRKSRWTDFWFRRDTIVRNFIHFQRRAFLLFEDYWKRDFRWNSYGYLESCSTARVMTF